VKSVFEALIEHGLVVELVDNINEPLSLSIYIITIYYSGQTYGFSMPFPFKKEGS
jgi:hypothetical protein